MQIIQKPTPHFRSGRRGHQAEAIVIHIMAGTLRGTDAWFADPASKVSAHYGVGKNGEVHQYVDESDTAYHAGTVSNPSWARLKGRPINPNLITIGIENEGQENDRWTEAMYAANAELIAQIAGRWGFPIDDQHVIPHRAIRATKTCPGTGVDLARLIELAREKQKEMYP